jgi:adenosine deaminase
VDAPLIDLHRHLEGSVRPKTVLALVEQHNLPLPRDLDALRTQIQVVEPDPDLMTFLAKIDRVVSVFADLDACERVAYECVEDAAQDGLAYLELRFSPLYMAMPHSLAPAALVEAVVAGVERGVRTYGVQTQLIGIMSRTFGPEAVAQELDALLLSRDHIAALDIAGDEARWAGDLFVDHFKRGRDAGWHVTVHAGEAAGPESVWTAITALGAERLGHAVRAIDDPKLLDVLAERGIGIESCLTSNIHTSTVADLLQHPLRAFLQHGVLATINTDDPAISGITLTHEIEVAAPGAGLSLEQIHTAKRNAIETAFLSEGDKRRLRAEVASGAHQAP